MSNKTPYLAFGQRLIELRQAAGILRQADFAQRISTPQQTVSQQSVSRWEAGTSRPREKQLPVIAGVLGVSVDDLRAAAGYGTKTVVVSFDQPFPVDALPPEAFERFCAYLLQRLYPGAAVHQAGARGHKQDGTDVLVTLEDGAIYSFQCKRTEEFGPQKVHAAVATHTVKADKKFLVLSRVASPQAREAIASHKGWDIWDRDDLSAKVRSLPKQEQIALVDIFFAGRRFELLGVAEESVWETTKDFFRVFENAAGLFNHTWQLVGRDKDLEAFRLLLENQSAKVVLLLGAGGSGKSRVLKHAIEAYEGARKGSTVRFLSLTTEVTKKSLEGFGDRPTLLVVDDAHDRNDLPPLFQYVATRDNVKLVLALRPYGGESLKAQLGNFSLIDVAKEIKLEPLTKQDAEELAKQVLTKEGGPLQAAKDIANLTYDCPLATVVGAQIVAREKKHFDLAKNEREFRSTLFGRFSHVIAGEIGQKADGPLIKKLLKVLALFQPFYLDDQALLSTIQNLEGIEPHDTNRLFKLLIDGGVLFKRGARYRLSPDVLADYIIEEICVGAEGQSTGYAEKAFDVADERLMQALLLNLGKLDWRLSDGDASNSHLMDGIWGKLKPSAEYDDSYIKAVKSVAFYQPERALDFAESLVREGRFTNQLAEIFKYAAYNFEYVSRACEGLWHLGRDDSRELHQHPNHPVRILAELCEVQPRKPLAYNKAVLEFGLKLAPDPAEWAFHYTPFDFVTAIFKTEGHTTASEGHTLKFSPFTVTPKAVVELRQQALEVAYILLGNDDIRIATRAAQAVGEALRFPIGLFNAKISTATRNAWAKIFCKTLEEVEEVIKKGNFDPLVLVEIARAVSWHANYGPEDTKKYAVRVRKALDRSLDYRSLSTLLDGHGTELRRLDPKNYQTLLNKHLEGVAKELISAYPSGEELRHYIAQKLEHIHKGSRQAAGSPYPLYATLLRLSTPLVRATVDSALADPSSRTARFAAAALFHIWTDDPTEGRRMAEKFLRSDNAHLMASVGQAVGSLDFKRPEYGEPEFALIEALVASNNADVVNAGVDAIRAVAKSNPVRAMEITRAVNVGGSHRVADELLCLFCFGSELPMDSLAEEDVDLFLDKLMGVSELEGHWTEMFLVEMSKKFPDKVLQFFMRRVEHAVATGDWNYRPVNHGPYVHQALKFKETSEYGSLLAATVSWMAKGSYEKDQLAMFKYRAQTLFEAAFGEFDSEVVAFIRQWSETADDEAFKLIANILEEAPYDFVFAQVPLVIDLLTKAQRVGPKAHKALVSALYGAAVTGERSGTAGEPFPRDIEARDKCEKILANISRFSPAFELYESILKNAKAEIERALRDREEFED